MRLRFDVRCQCQRNQKSSTEAKGSRTFFQTHSLLRRSAKFHPARNRQQHSMICPVSPQKLHRSFCAAATVRHRLHFPRSSTESKAPDTCHAPIILSRFAHLHRHRHSHRLRTWSTAHVCRTSSTDRKQIEQNDADNEHHVCRHRAVLLRTCHHDHGA